MVGRRLLRINLCIIVFVVGSLATFADGDGDRDFPVITHLPSAPTLSVSTEVPATTGDQNPYGVAFVPPEFPGGGSLLPGDILVANFNDNGNTQGTGTTLVSISPKGQAAVFFKSSKATGLSTALGVLRKGYVIVGNVPSADGSGVCTEGPQGQEENVGQGSLTILNRYGRVVKTLTSATFLDGPWDLTLSDQGDHALVFVSNALAGTVTRLNLRIHDGGSDDDAIELEKETQIASGYLHRCDSAAFVVGPTGLALDPSGDTLYVASTGDNEIFAIRNASHQESDRGTGNVFINDATHLHGPLGLALAPNGDLLSAQGDAVNFDSNHVSEIVEYSRQGQFVAEFSIDSSLGSAFGLAIVPLEDGFRFAAVDDGTNMLDVWDLR
jgi:hypothetical protein